MPAASGEHDARPTYDEIAGRLRDAEQAVADLQEENERLKAAVNASHEDGRCAAEAEDQGRKWQEFFSTSDVFREHIAPELGAGWTAILMEACGQAHSVPLNPRIERKTLKVDDALLSLPLLEWCARLDPADVDLGGIEPWTTERTISSMRDMMSPSSTKDISISS